MKSCDVADPVKEAQIVADVVKDHPVDAVVLGGTGLQETQIRSIQQALQPLRVEAFASHAGQDHDRLVKEMVDKGYKIMITQIASLGLDREWFCKIITPAVLRELFKRSQRYGFHCGGEGGYYDTLVVDGPIFEKRLEVKSFTAKMESEYAGHAVLEQVAVVAKATLS